MPDSDATTRKSVASRPRASRRPLPDLTPVIDLDVLHSETPDALIQRGAAYVRAYAQMEHAGTMLLKNLAEVLVELRTRNEHDGGPDMRGRSGPYREAAGEIYRSANVGDDVRERTQQAVRWHIGNILRVRLDPAELESFNLKPTSPLERGREAREDRAALASSVRLAETSAPIGEATPRATADHLRLAQGALDVLGRLNADVIKTVMTPGQRTELASRLKEIEELAHELRMTANGRRS